MSATAARGAGVGMDVEYYAGHGRRPGLQPLPQHPFASNPPPADDLEAGVADRLHGMWLVLFNALRRDCPAGDGRSNGAGGGRLLSDRSVVDRVADAADRQGHVPGGEQSLVLRAPPPHDHAGNDHRGQQHSVTTKKWDAIDKIAVDQDHVYFYATAVAPSLCPRPPSPARKLSNASWTRPGSITARQSCEPHSPMSRISNSAWFTIAPPSV